MIEEIKTGLFMLLICYIPVLFMQGIALINAKIVKDAEKLRPSYHVKHPDTDAIDVYVWQITKRSHYYEKHEFTKNKKGIYVSKTSGFIRFVLKLAVLVWAVLTILALRGYLQGWFELHRLIVLAGLPTVVFLYITLTKKIGGNTSVRAKKYLKEYLENGEQNPGPVPEDIEDFDQLDFIIQEKDVTPEARKAYQHQINKMREKFLLGFAIVFGILIWFAAIFDFIGSHF